MAADPSLMLNLARMPGLIGQSVFAGQEQAQQRQMNAQQMQIQQFKLAEAQRQQQQDQQYQVDTAEYLKDPSPARLMALGSKYPDKAEPLKKLWDTKDAAQRSADMSWFGSVYSSLKNNRPDLARSRLRERIDATKKAGGDTAELEEMLTAVDSGDPDAIKAAQGIVLAHLAAADYERFAANNKAVAGEVESGFTLGPGAKRFDANGKLIAQADFAPRPVTVPEGATVIEYDPNNSGGGDPSSGGGDTLSRMLPITISSESGGKEYAADGSRLTSPKGARGVMQVMPGTAGDPGYGIRKSDGTPADDARLGREYLAKMLDVYQDPAKAWAAYNAGPGAVDKAVTSKGAGWLQAMPAETRKYVAKNMAQLQRGGQSNGGVRVIAQGAPKPGWRVATPEEKTQYGIGPDVAAQIGPDGQVSILPGQSKTQLKTVPATIVNRVMENRKAVRNIDDALGELKKYPDGVGLVVGNVPNWISQRSDPKGVAVRGAIANIGSLLIHDRSGAAVTVAETPRLLPFVPLASDSAATAEKKLKRLRTEIASMNEDYELQYSEEQGYRPIAKSAAGSAPVKVRSVQEARKLPPGTVFITPDGRRKVR